MFNAPLIIIYTQIEMPMSVKNIHKIFFLGLLLLMACNGTSKNKKKEHKVLTHQKIKIHLQNDLLKVNHINNVTLAYYDLFGNRIQYDFDMREKNGHHFEIEATNPIYLKDLSLKQTNYLLFPNEELNGTIDSLGFINFTAKNSVTKRTNELAFFNVLNKADLPSNKILAQALARFPGISNLLTHRKSETFLDFLLIENVSREKSTQYSLMKYQDQVSFLNTYAKNYPISSAFKAEMLTFFKISNIKFNLNIALKTQAEQKRSPESDQIVDLIHQLSCDDCLNIPAYQESIQKYVDYLINTRLSAGQLSLYQELKRNFKGKTADFATFSLLKTLIEKHKNIDQQLTANFKKENRTSLYVTFIKDFEKIKATVPASTILSPTGEITSLETIVAHHKGKVIYLDLWASWCIPCKQNIPFSKALEKKYKDKKVQFIFLSLDHQKSAWQVSNKELMLSSSYLLVDNFSSKFAKSLKVNTIPRYVLIDQQGKIFDENAPRPNDKKIITAIDAMLSSSK